MTTDLFLTAPLTLSAPLHTQTVQSYSDHARHFSHRCHIYKVVKWFAETGQTIKVTSLIQSRTDTITRTLLANIRLPFSSRRHMLNALSSLCAAFDFNLFFVVVENQSSKITAGTSDCLLILFLVYADLNR